MASSNSNKVEMHRKVAWVVNDLAQLVCVVLALVALFTGHFAAVPVFMAGWQMARWQKNQVWAGGKDAARAAIDGWFKGRGLR